MMDGDMYLLLHPKFDVIEHIGVISEREGGWRRELNLISWNGQPPKYDIRYWTEGREHYSRAVTLHPKEMEHVIKLTERHMGTAE